MESITMESLFKKVNLDYLSMEKNTPYDVSEKNIRVRSYNHELGRSEFAKVLSLIRKDDVEEYNLVLKNGDILLRCSGEHRVYNVEEDDYYYIKDIEKGVALDSNNNKIPFFVIKTGKVIPIVDMTVEGNENYFTNGLLSHNTGGNALKFYASQRIQVRKAKTNDDSEGEAISNFVNIKIAKNKVAPPFRVVEEKIIFGKGLSVGFSFLNWAIKYGVIEKKGAWFAYEGEIIGQGIDNTGIVIESYIRDGKPIIEEIRKKVLEKKNGVVIADATVEEENKNVEGMEEAEDIVFEEKV